MSDTAPVSRTARAFLALLDRETDAGRRVLLVAAFRGRYAIVQQNSASEWVRTHAVNGATLRALHRRDLIEYDADEAAPYYQGRERGESGRAAAVTLTAAGRHLLG